MPDRGLADRELKTNATAVAGTEYSGPDAGFAELFVDRWCILTLPDFGRPHPGLPHAALPKPYASDD